MNHRSMTSPLFKTMLSETLSQFSVIFLWNEPLTNDYPSFSDHVIWNLFTVFCHISVKWTPDQRLPLLFRPCYLKPFLSYFCEMNPWSTTTLPFQTMLSETFSVIFLWKWTPDQGPPLLLKLLFLGQRPSVFSDHVCLTFGLAWR